jgi:DNA polymerase III epsilon subunit-like protein
MNYATHPVVVFDFETGGLDTAKLEPLQIGCVAIDMARLEIIAGSEFVSDMRPVDPDNIDARAVEINGIGKDRRDKAPEQGLVWKRFADHVKKYKARGGGFNAPMPGGKGIRRFDIPIAQRLCKTYGMVGKGGQQNLFNNYLLVDIEDDLYRWFGQTGLLPNIKLDTVRDYLGMDKAEAHDALVDSRQSAQLIIDFFKLMRELAKKVKFKGSKAA